MFFPVFFLNKTFFSGDNFSLLIPGKMYFVDSIRSGSFPLWNPYLMGGQPFFADINQSILYPSTVLFFLFPAVTALNATILLHMTIGGLGIYAIARSLKQEHVQALIASTLWMLSIQVVSIANNITDIQSKAWIPWVLYVAIRTSEEGFTLKNVLRATAVLLLCILGGHPYQFWYAVIMAGSYLVCSKGKSFFSKTGTFIIAGILAIGILLFQFVPFFEMLSQSTRTRINTQEVFSGSLPPSLLIELIIPNFFNDPAAGISWGANWGIPKFTQGYVTAIGLVAVVIFALFHTKKTREQKILLGLAFAGLLLSHGRYIPYWETIYRYIPLIRSIRSPGIFITLWVVATPILASWALSDLHDRIKKKQFLVYALSGIAVLLLFLRISYPLWFSTLWSSVDRISRGKLSTGPFHTFARDEVIGKSILDKTFVVALATSAALYLLTRKRLQWKALLCVLAIDMALAMSRSIMLADASVFDLVSRPARILQERMTNNERYMSFNGYFPWTGFTTYFDDMVWQPPFVNESRFTAVERKTFRELKNRRDNLTSNWGQLYRLPTPFGFTTFVLQSAADYWKNGEEGSNINEVDKVPLEDQRINDQGIKYMIVDKLIFPQTYISQHYPWLTLVEDGDTFAIYENPHVLPVIRQFEHTNGSIRGVSILPNSVRFIAENKVVQDITTKLVWYPGWECTIAGSDCQLVNDNGWIRVRVPAGKQEVTLQYAIPHFSTLRAISGTALGIYILLVLLAWAPRGSLGRIGKKIRMYTIG
ncbi:MAG TPA: hypothetical protein VJ246_01615 [Patescibacteria group bacterium]|nr:hypothetical protein [Patescibacteria group bacterium]